MTSGQGDPGRLEIRYIAGHDDEPVFERRGRSGAGVARSERFELPTLGIEIRCSIQLSYERVRRFDYQTWRGKASRLAAGHSRRSRSHAVGTNQGDRRLWQA